MSVRVNTSDSSTKHCRTACRCTPDLHAHHHLYRALEGARQEEIRLDELAAEDDDPEGHGRQMMRCGKSRVRHGEWLSGQILARFACDPVAEHSLRRQGGEQYGGDHRYEELYDAQNE